MSFAAGDKLGPYQVTSRIGVGGMGEVYRAHDSRLNREVAIKVSAEQFSDRFEREARAVAALNHPNICTLYDVGPDYLVMEYVEGENLKGPLPLDEALRIARQIADALEEAHAKGVVHRDLKPGNIKVRPDGTIKVLDFGLAKMGGTPAVPSQDSPTISIAATQAGVILGTAAYMSPEQARGKAVDKRTDIWAFGVVLYEMLTGEQLFQGEDLTDTLAAVVRKEPDWERVPIEVRRLLKACLEKDPKRRLRDIADAWRLLDEAPASTTGSTSVSQSRMRLVTGAAAAGFAVIAGVLAFVHFRETPPIPATVRFEISAPEKTVLAAFPPAVSPDGRSVAFVARGEDGQDRIWIRSIDSLEPRMLRGTEGVRLPGAFWSPDSRFLGFFAAGLLKKIDASGGPPLTLGDVGGVAAAAGGSWSADGVILVGSPQGVYRISQAGGAAELVTKSETNPTSPHAFPHFLPDGRHFLFLATVSGSVHLGSLDGQVRERLVEGVSRAQYVPPAARGEPAHLMYVRDATLMAQPIDPSTFNSAGDPFPLAEQLEGAFGGAVAYFSASPSGVLAYRTGAFSRALRVTWFDRAGNSLGSIGPAGNYTEVALSRAGDRVAVAFVDARSVTPDIWLMDAKQGVPSRLTTSPGVEVAPVWSPDDQRLAFSSGEGQAVAILSGFVKNLSGTGSDDQVLKAGRIRDWSSDGRYLLYDDRGANGRFQFSILPLQGDRTPVLYALDRFTLAQGQFAPDVGGGPGGPPKWIAYVSNESGDNEIYVQAFPPNGRGIRDLECRGHGASLAARRGRTLLHRARGKRDGYRGEAYAHIRAWAAPRAVQGADRHWRAARFRLPLRCRARWQAIHRADHAASGCPRIVPDYSGPELAGGAEEMIHKRRGVRRAELAASEV
jgi:Tol biopolymer transport system component/predicted Ser/Thr protein kinase